ncbi:Si-specific NAD(P)(+) transhydrogenase [candidate division KSB1 bacterium]|nr:Si-specific NAD(P)(+) transhydrogenase [candidate division KSB1 bacterium]NIR69284.1 Si-specific NAD(P)(+) transhydrogenase [candidate division KSB1 bacterium]NIS25719.1 Si-specific NAD(P)(+) transhydrogenase [candidate division KSB1 bacterium]NIT72575.1 Si-specific NAD(P)(+) transhydrogenase [candidate division KSB1 bacterium]NIU26404.1 Si-specific NAD(P)(+) transhydrogenase [candidate division KSB1 bacterium]
MSSYDYDLVVIGSGPAGQKAAIQAAKLDKRVAVVERKAVVGGVCINTGTIPSKTLREAVIYLSGYRHHNIYGKSYKVKDRITAEDLMFRIEHVVRHEIDVIRDQLLRNGIDVLNAEASFIEPHTLRLNFVDGSAEREIAAANTVIATGTKATQHEHIPFDGKNVLTSDDILELDEIPRTLTVVGAGVIGLEYASMFAALDVRVTLVDKRERLLPFIDEEIIDTLIYHLRQNRVTLHLGEEVTGIECLDDPHQSVRINLKSGKKIRSEKALYSIGRTGATDSLKLENAGLDTVKHQLLDVNENYQTSVAHIYAVGDVIGFPSLASTSMEQGRLASCHAFGVETKSIPELFPYGIYSVPEISTVGRNEEELTSDGVPYEIGKAQYQEIARGQIIGDNFGTLKLLFHLETKQLLGVHIIGEGASELVHIGQAVMAFGGTVDYFVNTVFNYPTLAECYKTAALDGLNRLAM